MKPARVFYVLGVVWRPCVSSSSDALGILWEYMVWQGLFRHFIINYSLIGRPVKELGA